MKYRIEHSKRFKKALKKLCLDDVNLVLHVVGKLANDEPLDSKYKDHKLKGNLEDFRECHIKPDLLLIYQKQEDILILTCISVGSHGTLFKL